MTSGQRLKVAKTAKERRALETAELVLEASGLRYQSGQIPGLALILIAFADNELRLAASVPARPSGDQP